MSKELEALKTILKWFDDEHMGLDEVVKESEEWKIIVNVVKAGIKFREISQRTKVLIKGIEQELKALEIIKEKGVDVSCLLFDGLEIYNECMPLCRVVTKEEYDLLKEVLL